MKAQAGHAGIRVVACCRIQQPCVCLLLLLQPFLAEGTSTPRLEMTTGEERCSGTSTPQLKMMMNAEKRLWTERKILSTRQVSKQFNGLLTPDSLPRLLPLFGLRKQKFVPSLIAKRKTQNAKLTRQGT
ncbi:hypothetical protein BC567DRAFT_235360 [Phyllosticta citribraziliensis]